MGMAGFTIALIVICVIISPCDVYGQEFSNHQEIEVERLLKQLNKPALLSIKSEDGDIIDCVPIHKQPAFDHPLLKNHTIQMRPSFIPESTYTYTRNKIKATQVWNKNGSCPENTVPIRRTKKEDILRSKSIENYGKKTTPGILLYGASSVHEHSVMSSQGGMYYGTKFVVNIWKPYVQYDTEFSLAQTWLLSGSGTTLNSVEAGFQVYPGIYGDDNLRLFVYWTRDGYSQTGCYNTLCPGFVQLSKVTTVGGTFNAVSQYGGAQIEIPIHIWLDKGTWWLMVQNDVVGYWPDTLFTSLHNQATVVQWGGEIVNDKTGGIHTATNMGSGQFAEQGYQKASYFKNLMTIDKNNIPSEPQGAYPITTNDNCYNLKVGASGTSWGLNFYYGGPGLNAKCP